MNPVRRLLFVCGCCSLVGCASGPIHTPSPTLSTWTPPAGQSCEIVRGQWSELPGLGDLADSTALIAAAARLAPSRGGHLLVSIAYDSTGGPVRTRVLEGTLRAEAAAELAHAVVPALRPLPEGHPRRLRLRLGLDRPLDARLGWAEECMPALTNRTEVARLLEGVKAVAGVGTARLWVYVDATGRPIETKIEESSGNAPLDRLVEAVGRRMEFHPGLNDRVPVALWVEVPVTVR